MVRVTKTFKLVDLLSVRLHTLTDNRLLRLTDTSIIRFRHIATCGECATIVSHKVKKKYVSLH